MRKVKIDFQMINLHRFSHSPNDFRLQHCQGIQDGVSLDFRFLPLRPATSAHQQNRLQPQSRGQENDHAAIANWAPLYSRVIVGGFCDGGGFAFWAFRSIYK